MDEEFRRGVVRGIASHYPGKHFTHQDPSHKSKKGSSKRFKSQNLRWLGLVPVIIIVIVSLVLLKSPINTLPYPIPAQSAKTLGFNIYYPNQKLLPTGYVLNMSSFSYSNQTIICDVSYGNNQKIILSDQAKPTPSQIQTFYARNMPLNTTLSTKIGTATIGAIGSQTVVSIPTTTNAWLIITTPSTISQQKLDAIIKSVELAK